MEPQHHHRERAPRPTLGADSRRNGLEDAEELGAGEEVVAIKANGEVDPVQAGVDGCWVQLTLHKLALGVPHVFTAVTRGTSQEIAPGSRMRHSSGAEAQASSEEDEEVVDLVLLGSTS